MRHLSSSSVELQSADPNHRGHWYDFERDSRSRGAGRTDSFYCSIITSHMPTVCEIPVCCVTQSLIRISISVTSVFPSTGGSLLGAPFHFLSCLSIVHNAIDLQAQH